MKKLLAVILILALLLPAASLAEDMSKAVGVWLAHELLTDGAPSMSYLYLAEDHTCYFVIQAFHPDSPGLGRQYVGTWSFLSDDQVYAKTGNNTDTTLTLCGDYSLDQNMNIYAHVPTLTVQDVLAMLGY